MSVEVTIRCGTPPPEVDSEEYIDDDYVAAIDRLTNNVMAAVAAGARVDNIAEAVKAGLENAGAE